MQKLIFEERTTQLNEIASQVRINLGNALDAHWNYLTAAVNTVKTQEFGSLEDMTACLGELERLLETDSYSSRLLFFGQSGKLL